ncbi:MAG: tetratricopeptide repeat protein [Methanomethylovorans sp.]|uniref:tetratricopeptide repeat protein n=1 Tax=Methanomethylovorans sp. TaxID=2758717 RepID=UPI003C76E469
MDQKHNISDKVESLKEEFKKEPSLEVMVQVIAAYHEQGLTERGIGFAEAVLLQVDDEKTRSMQMGMIMELVGRNEEALTYLDKALKISPTDPQVLHAKGMLLVVNGNFEDAALIYRKLRDENAADLQAISGMLLCLFGEGRSTDALALYQESTGTLPKDPHEWHPKGMIDGIVAAYFETTTSDDHGTAPEKIKESFRRMEDIIGNFGTEVRMFYTMGEIAGSEAFRKIMEKKKNKN